MFCKKCGKELPEETRFCPDCGADLNKENTIKATPLEPAPNNYMILGILTTVFCCLIFGIVSIVYASRVDSYWNAGNREAAMEFSKKAKGWALWGIGLTISAYILVFLFSIIAYGAGLVSMAYLLDAFNI